MIKVVDLFFPKSRKTWENFTELKNHGAHYNRAREGLIIRGLREDSDLFSLFKNLKLKFRKENAREVVPRKEYHPYKDD